MFGSQLRTFLKHLYSIWPVFFLIKKVVQLELNIVNLEVNQLKRNTIVKCIFDQKPTFL